MKNKTLRSIILGMLAILEFIYLVFSYKQAQNDIDYKLGQLNEQKTEIETRLSKAKKTAYESLQVYEEMKKERKRIENEINNLINSGSINIPLENYSFLKDRK